MADITKVPDDYASLGFKNLLISHHPVSSSAAPSLPPQTITVVTLNRPTRLNAFSNDLAYELEAVFEIMSNDDRIRCIVLTGAGRAFCAGADLVEGVLTSDVPAEQHRDEYCPSLSLPLLISTAAE
jgi:enoyl-CoA hydratase/carnithine racemase